MDPGFGGKRGEKKQNKGERLPAEGQGGDGAEDYVAECRG
jgi:hypothetical protein